MMDVLDYVKAVDETVEAFGGGPETNYCSVKCVITYSFT